MYNGMGFLLILSDVYFYLISVVFCKHRANSSAILRFWSTIMKKWDNQLPFYVY